MSVLPLDVATLTIDAVGQPVGQGSKRIVGRGRVPRLIDDNANALRPWRKNVTDAARARIAVTGWATLDVACSVKIRLLFTRPKSVRRDLMCVKPDVDKAARAILDSLTEAGVWSDDSRVASLTVSKHYTTGQPGARIVVSVMS